MGAAIGLAAAGVVITIIIGISQMYQSHSQNASATSGTVGAEMQEYTRLHDLFEQLCIPDRGRLLVKHARDIDNGYDLYSHHIADLADHRVPGERVRLRLIGLPAEGKWRVQLMKWSWDTCDAMFKGKSLPQIQEYNYNMSASANAVEYSNCWWKQSDTVELSSRVAETLRSRGVVV